MEDIQKNPPTPHIAIVPTPGVGHLYPLIEFAKRLVAHHGVAVTFLIPNDGSSMELQKKILQSLPKPIAFVLLPPANLDDLPKDALIETRIELTLTRSLPALREPLKAIKADQSTRLVALVTDIHGPSTFDIAQELGILPYIFFSTSAMVLSFFFYLPKLDALTTSEYRHLPEPIKLPGCAPVQGCDLFSPLQNRKTQTYKSFVRMADRYNLAHGIMVNSFMDLEPGAFMALKERVHHNPPVYPVGPMIKTARNESSDQSGCLSWLDQQPNASVMLVSFGSGGTLSQEQLTELAFGLEESGQRFLWVVKSPSEKAADAAFFSLKSTKNPFEFLPEGFLERTKDVGLVVDSWAPQVQVLSHGSTGGFLSHCGWNSAIESVLNGVPLIAWPLYAEQRMNAVFFADELKVALRVKVNEKGIVGREEIAKYAKELMEGEQGMLMRGKMKELKEAAEMALSDEGSSTKSLAEVVEIWKSHKN